MAPRLRLLQERALPHGWLDVVRQLLLFGSAYYGYVLVRSMVEGQSAAAFAHARELISLERAMHFFVELSVQAWAAGSHVMISAASWMYLNTQTSITVGALAFLYLFHNRSFYFVRNMFMVSMGIALIAYILFPTAPPRLLPEWGFFDAVADYTGVPATNRSVSSFFNLYAAVPSMHVAFALMLSVPLSRLVRSPIARVLWTVYPLVVTFVIVATANHFLFDALLGAATAGASAYAAGWLARTRPHVWRFEPVGAGAPA